MTNSPVYVPYNPMIVTPYEADCLNRAKAGKRLTQLVARLPHGGVIGVDGGWGDGKTWFAKHWLASLGTEQPAVYIDAFECDFANDAFASIACAILEAVQKPQVKVALKQQLIKAMLAVVGVGAKLAVKAGASAVTGGASKELLEALAQAAGELANEGIDAGLSTLKAAIEAAAARRDSLGGLRNAIAAFVGEQPLPLIIVVDELDRCRPEYAFQMLDCIKHLFDMPGVVFVLFLNRAQMESSVATRHGPPMGQGYLDKFVHLWINLSAGNDPLTRHGLTQAKRLLQAMFQRVQVDLGDTPSDLAIHMAPYAYCMRLGPRDVERAVTALAASSDPGLIWTGELGLWLLCLKAVDSRVYRAVVKNEASGHRDAAALAKSALDRCPKNLPDALLLMEQVELAERLHRHFNGVTDPNTASAVAWVPFKNHVEVLAHITKMYTALES